MNPKAADNLSKLAFVLGTAYKTMVDIEKRMTPEQKRRIAENIVRKARKFAEAKKATTTAAATSGVPDGQASQR